jgi:hypothetical protein
MNGSQRSSTQHVIETHTTGHEPMMQEAFGVESISPAHNRREKQGWKREYVESLLSIIRVIGPWMLP